MKTMLDVLELPDGLRRLVNWILREGSVTAAQTASFLNTDESTARTLLHDMQREGYVYPVGGDAQRYEVRLTKRGPKRAPDIWNAFD